MAAIRKSAKALDKERQKDARRAKIKLAKKTIKTSSHAITHLARLISRHYQVILLRTKNKLILSKNRQKKLKKRSLKWQSSRPNLVVSSK